MPTARELLDQADALMRRNRKRGKPGSGDPPTLTDALGAGRDLALAPTLILPDAQPAASNAITLDVNDDDASASREAVDVDADPISLDTLADVPILTDAVLDWSDETAIGPESPATPQQPEPIDSVEPNEAVAAGDAFPASAAEAEAAAAELPPPAVIEREADDVPSTPAADDAAHAGAHAPATPRVPFLDDDFILELPPDANAAAAAPASAVAAIAPTSPIPPVPSGGGEWDAMAEEIRMQVLQRLDLFTDTGLREQLGARLAPIVERASAQLVETINRELGQLVRGYVAEAIEREIESWRNRNPKPK